MYEKHFGLKSRPFRSSLDASGIFVGPAQVKAMTGLKKALAASDAVVSVTGAVGIGKTTVVNRALEAITSKRAVARVARMQLAADEVLELLLTEFNVSRQPTGTIQRFAAFKRLIHDWAAAGTRAFIIVEDAERIGNDALIELEALTASDSGDSTGASIILMGQPSLAERLSLPELARLRQRMRLRQSIIPFTAVEVQGYLRHCIRAAGGEFDAIFDPGAIDMLYRCSEGVPRVINNLCESVLAAAAEAGATLIMPQLVQHVANEEFGLQPTLPAASRSRAAKKPDPEVDRPLPRPATPQKTRVDVKPTVATPAAAETAVKAETAAAEIITTEFEPIPVVPFTPEPEVTRPVAFEPTVAPAVVADTPKQAVVVAPPVVAEVPTPTVGVPPSIVVDAPQAAVAEVALAGPGELPLEHIPELIQDTQPELIALQSDTDLPDLTDLVMPARSNGAAKVAPKAKAASEFTLPTLDDIPTLSGDFRIDTRAKAAPSKSAQTRSQQPNAGPSKAESAKPLQVEQAQAKTVQSKIVVDSPPVTVKEISKADTTITEIPAWDRDPTLAELKPDIEALEAALAAVPEPAAKPEAKSVLQPASAPASERAKAKATPHNFDLPEINLEKKLQVKEIEAQELIRKSASPDTREADADTPLKRKHGFDLDRLAEELGKARSLEDVDDKLAETLFGEEMAQAAAEVAAMVTADAAAKNPARNDAAMTSNLAEPAPVIQKAPANAPPAAPPAAARTATGTASGTAPRSAPESAPRRPPPANTNAATAKTAPIAPSAVAARSATSAPSTTAGKNVATAKPMPPVRGPAMEIILGNHPDAAPASSTKTPDPIEQQFGTSMTATLKALSATQIRQLEEPESDQKDKLSSRLFGFFRGSS